MSLPRLSAGLVPAGMSRLDMSRTERYRTRSQRVQVGRPGAVKRYVELRRAMHDEQVLCRSVFRQVRYQRTRLPGRSKSAKDAKSSGRGAVRCDMTAGKHHCDVCPSVFGCCLCSMACVEESRREAELMRHGDSSSDGLGPSLRAGGRRARLVVPWLPPVSSGRNAIAEQTLRPPRSYEQ